MNDTTQKFECQNNSIALDIKILSLLDKQPMTISELLDTCNDTDRTVFYEELIHLLADGSIHSISISLWQELIDRFSPLHRKRSIESAMLNPKTYFT